MDTVTDTYKKAAKVIRSAKRVAAFTGAGISVESGIPPFRGDNGLWVKYNPDFLEIGNFRRSPKASWELLKTVFYEGVSAAQPNAAHFTLAAMEKKHMLETLITQNIDSLHQKAGSRKVYEFHGTLRTLVCLGCSKTYPLADVDLAFLPPECRICGGLLKPDVVLFGEPIPEPANSQSFFEAEIADVLLVIGTSGEIMPASLIPHIAKGNGATIIEINVQPSEFTRQITDIMIQAKATEAMSGLARALDIAIPSQR
ncbi:MAG TPA: NAD-dependent deacylase [bacterium]|jgi:NAD-dependent deacetylase